MKKYFVGPSGKREFLENTVDVPSVPQEAAQVNEPAAPQDPDDLEITFVKEPIAYDIPASVGGSRLAHLCTVDGLSVRRWLGTYLYASQLLTKDDDIPEPRILAMFANMEHTGMDFEGRRMSGFYSEEIDEWPPELLFLKHLPKNFAGLSVFGAPKIVRRILRANMPQLADIDQVAAYLVARNKRVNGDEVRFPILKHIMDDVHTHRAELAAKCNIDDSEAKMYFSVLGGGGSLQKWELEIKKPVLDKLPQLYSDFAKELLECRAYEEHKHPTEIAALKAAGKKRPAVSLQCYLDEKGERQTLDEMQRLALSMRIVLLVPEHDGGVFHCPEAHPGWQSHLVDFFAHHGIKTSWKQYPDSLETCLAELHAKFGGDWIASSHDWVQAEAALLRAIPERYGKCKPDKDFAVGIAHQFHNRIFRNRKLLEKYDEKLGRWHMDEGEALMEALRSEVSDALVESAAPLQYTMRKDPVTGKLKRRVVQLEEKIYKNAGFVNSISQFLAAMLQKVDVPLHPEKSRFVLLMSCGTVVDFLNSVVRRATPGDRLSRHCAQPFQEWEPEPDVLQKGVKLVRMICDYLVENKYKKRPSENPFIVAELKLFLPHSKVLTVIASITATAHGPDWDVALWVLFIQISTITGLDKIDFLWVFSGRGGGKDTLAKMPMTLLGDEEGNYVTVLEAEDIAAKKGGRRGGGPDPFMHACRGSRMMVASEIDCDLDTDKLQKLVDPLGVPQATRGLYTAPEQWRTQATMWGLSNNVPGVNKAKAEGMRRRLMLLNLLLSFKNPDEMPEEPKPHVKQSDPRIREMIKECGPELLWWCRQFFLMLKQQPGENICPRPARVTEALESFWGDVHFGENAGDGNPTEAFSAKLVPCSIDEAPTAAALEKIVATFTGKDKALSRQWLQDRSIFFDRTSSKKYYKKMVDGSWKAIKYVE